MAGMTRKLRKEGGLKGWLGRKAFRGEMSLKGGGGGGGEVSERKKGGEIFGGGKRRGRPIEEEGG